MTPMPGQIAWLPDPRRPAAESRNLMLERESLQRQAEALYPGAAISIYRSSGSNSEGWVICGAGDLTPAPGADPVLRVVPGPGSPARMDPELGPLSAATYGKASARAYKEELARRKAYAHRQGKDLAVSPPTSDGKSLTWQFRLLGENETAPPKWSVYATGAWHWSGRFVKSKAE